MKKITVLMLVSLVILSSVVFAYCGPHCQDYKIEKETVDYNDYENTITGKYDSDFWEQRKIEQQNKFNVRERNWKRGAVKGFYYDLNTHHRAPSKLDVKSKKVLYAQAEEKDKTYYSLNEKLEKEGYWEKVEQETVKKKEIMNRRRDYREKFYNTHLIIDYNAAQPRAERQFIYNTAEPVVPKTVEEVEVAEATA